MATVARENIGLLNDKIIIKVSKEDYLPTFEKKLKEYSKTVNIPGFRKGMVPAGMIKKMYGPSIYTDEILKTVEKQLHTYLDTEKPDIFAQPLALDADIRKMDLNNPADYEFGFEIGLKPAFTIAPLKNAGVTLNKVKVTDEMVEEEVSNMLNKAGKMTEPETIESENAVLNVKFTASDNDGNVTENGINEIETSVIIKYLTPGAQQQFMGKKKDDSVVIELSTAFEKDKLAPFVRDLGLTDEEVEGIEKYFKLTILKIGLLEKAELNEEFYDKVFAGAAIATEEEFRKKLKEEIEQYWDGQSRIQLQDQIYHYLLDETNIEFPAEFLKRWLQTGSEERKTAEQAEEEFPTFSGQLKWTLISDKLIKENNIAVTLEELKVAMRMEVMRYFGNMNIGDDTSWLDSYIDKMMKDEKQLDATYRRLLTDKLFAYAESEVNPVENEVSAEELTGMQHHH
ncbi:MAG: trigger factor [Ferruginibacter sp.]|nr:trigger factor [Ferruginibacter sp.]